MVTYVPGNPHDAVLVCSQFNMIRNNSGSLEEVTEVETAWVDYQIFFKNHGKYESIKGGAV